MKILGILEASRQEGVDFVPHFFWRWNQTFQQVRTYARNGQCGPLRSVRFTYARPKKFAVDRNTFFYDRFGAMLDAACELGGGMPDTLFLNPSKDSNLIYGLARFSNGIACEFECHECLADSMPDICYVKGNYTNGHVTNQPVTGYFNEEGFVYADDEKCHILSADYPEMEAVEGPVEHMFARFRIAVERGLVAPGPDRTQELVKRIQEVLS